MIGGGGMGFVEADGDLAGAEIYLHLLDALDGHELFIDVAGALGAGEAVDEEGGGGGGEGLVIELEGGFGDGQALAGLGGGGGCGLGAAGGEERDESC